MIRELKKEKYTQLPEMAVMENMRNLQKALLKRAALLPQGKEFDIVQLMHPLEKRFSSSEFGMQMNDLLLETRAYEMVEVRGNRQKYIRK